MGWKKRHSIHSMDEHSIHSMDEHSIHSIHSIHSLGSSSSTGSNSQTLPRFPRFPTPSTPSTLSTRSTPSLAPRCASRWPPAPCPRDARAARARSAYLTAPLRLYVDSDANTSLQNEHGHTFSSSLSDGSTFYLTASPHSHGRFLDVRRREAAGNPHARLVFRVRDHLPRRGLEIGEERREHVDGMALGERSPRGVPRARGA